MQGIQQLQGNPMTANNMAGQMPQQQPQQAQQGQFTSAHHNIYEKLRGVLMNLHTQGVPGMDQVLQALHKVHVGQLGQSNQPPTMPKQQAQGFPQMPQGQKKNIPAVMGAVSMGQLMQQNPGASVEDLRDLASGVPIGFFRWLENTKGVNGTQLLPQELQSYVSQFMSLVPPATKSLGSVSLDALPIIAPLSVYQKILQPQGGSTNI